MDPRKLLNKTEILSTSNVTNEPAKQSEFKKYDAVIVGAGLGGLTAAVEASKSGKTVLVIEYRQEKFAAIRPQLIFIYHDNRAYLRSLKPCLPDYNETKDKVLFQRLDTYGHFAIKDIQRYLIRRIDRKYCTFQYETIVSEINLEEGYLVTTNVTDPARQEKIRFEHLVIADGAKHHTANLLKPSIEYQPVASRAEKKHVMGYFTVKSKGDVPLPIPLEDAIAAVIHDNNCGLIYHEDNLLKNDKTTLKFCLVMNLTDQQFEQYKADKESGVKFLKYCIANIFDEAHWEILMTNSVKSGNEKDKLKYAAFELDFIEVNKPAFEYNGYKIIFVGDARRTPDFYQGHGGNDAIIDGYNAAQIFEKTLSIEKYNTMCQESSTTISFKTLNLQPILTYFQEHAPQKFIVPTFKDDVITNTPTTSAPTTSSLGIFTPAIKTELQPLIAEDLPGLRN